MKYTKIRLSSKTFKAAMRNKITYPLDDLKLSKANTVIAGTCLVDSYYISTLDNQFFKFIVIRGLINQIKYTLYKVMDKGTDNERLTVIMES